ncbi:AMP-dependent synthetase/ligase [Myxococcota bacterium]
MTEPRTIPEMFLGRVRRSGTDDAVFVKRDGQWSARSWSQLEEDIRSLARGIGEWVAPGDNVALLSENRPEWWIADLTILSLGAVSAAIYPTNPRKDTAYILNDCGAKLLFVSTEEQLDNIRALKADGELPMLERVIILDDVNAAEDWVTTLCQAQARGTDAPDPVDERLAAIDPEGLATLCYTSGTTGEPKGVMLSHRNIVSNVMGAHAIVDALDFAGERLLLSFLPLSHSFERTVGYYGAIELGFKVAFAEDITTLLANFSEIRPTMLVSVPRIYEKVYAKVMGSTTGVRRKLLLWALDVGKEYARYDIAGQPVPAGVRLRYRLAARLVFSKMHAKLGGRLRYAVSGSAPLAVEVAEFLNAIGLRVYEGYGLSETSPVLTANQPGKVKVGSVGVPWPGAEIRVEPEPGRDGEGEILARGPGIMLGYYNKPEATAEVLNEDGWLRTGDIGFVDNEGFLFITDRKKELIKTAGGKYVAPQPIENALKVHPLVEQAVVIGDRRKYCVALLVPSFEALTHVMGPLPQDRDALNDPTVMAEYQRLVDEVNRDLGRWEQIKRFSLLSQEMTQDTGELTPTLKVKRRVVDEKFKDIIDSLYD